MHRRWERQVVLSAALVCCLVAAAAAGQRGREPDERSRPRAAEARERGSEGDSYFHRRGYTRLNIPKGHYPPPGACRVWYPDRPPGHQPPPGRCDAARVPPGAWLLRHPQNDPDLVHVVVYDERRPQTVLAVGEFRIGSGVFVRVVVDR